MAAEVMGALDAAGADDDAARRDTPDYAGDDMHVEANDMSLVSKRGRLLASFRKGRSS
jgi:hypothetical protein